MNAEHLTLFPTPIGHCALAWNSGGITAVALPEQDEDTLRAVLWRKHPDATESPPAPEIQAVIEGLLALLGGARPDLSGARLNMERTPAFPRRVYDVARRIPAGETRTYGEIARELGQAGAARAVGRALGQNPFPLIVPCHRVLAANGKHGGFSATGGVALKLDLLRREGAHLPVTPDLFENHEPVEPRANRQQRLHK